MGQAPGRRLSHTACQEMPEEIQGAAIMSWYARPDGESLARVTTKSDWSEGGYVSADPRGLYASMRPDQRTAIAHQFVRLFTIADVAKRLRLVPGDRTREDMLSAEQVAALHTYAWQHAPSVLLEVFHHPVTQAVLAAQGTASDTGISRMGRAHADHSQRHESARQQQSFRRMHPRT